MPPQRTKPWTFCLHLPRNEDQFQSKFVINVEIGSICLYADIRRCLPNCQRVQHLSRFLVDFFVGGQGCFQHGDPFCILLGELIQKNWLWIIFKVIFRKEQKKRNYNNCVVFLKVCRDCRFPSQKGSLVWQAAVLSCLGLKENNSMYWR